MKPDPTKIEAILKMPPPTDKKGVERLLGTVNYLAKFVPIMSAINEPIRSLLRSDVLFIWGNLNRMLLKLSKTFCLINEL